MEIRTLVASFLLGSLPACSKSPSPAPTAASAAAMLSVAGPTGGVVLGLQPNDSAPDFDLPDLDGKRVKLSDFKGKTVVLEWFNPECPFVRKSHTVGSLIDTAKRHTNDGVVWLAINSGAPGKQGHGVEINKRKTAEYAMTHPVLIDESGEVGRRYGAKRTPHMFVIAPDGRVAYQGAIDNSPDAERESPTDGKLVNYVDDAVSALKAGRKPSVQRTEAYGCSVKYAG